MINYFPSLADLSMKVIYESLNELLSQALAEDEFVEPLLKWKSRSKELQLTFKDFVFLPETLSERLITMLSTNGLLNQYSMSLFSYKNTCLRHVKIPDATSLCRSSLNILKEHKIKELEINNLPVTVDNLISSLDDWSLNNLEKLNVSHTTLLNSMGRYSVIISLTKLKNLRELDVSFTEFNSHNLKIIVEDLPRLESLNISFTHVDDISPLRECKNRLKKLIMADLKLPSLQLQDHSDIDSHEKIIFQLTELRYLDISFQRVSGGVLFERHSDAYNILPIIPGEQNNFRIINHPDKLPHLISLDVSGHENMNETDLIVFLRDHPDLKFLGLMNTNVCSSDVFLNKDNPDYRPDLKVTGTGSLEQVILSMKLYEKRTTFIQKCLYTVYTSSERSELGARPDLIELVTIQMRIHYDLSSIQLASTACLYNLTKWVNNDSFSIPPLLMSEVAELTLNAMERFPKHFQLQKNALLTLCNDHILQDIKMDRFRCTKLVLDAFCQFSSEMIERLCVAISSIVAAKISSEQTTEIGCHTRYMQKLLAMVKRKLDIFVVDSSLRFALSTMWNLTDESPQTCVVFLTEGGLELFTKMLEEYTDSESVLTRILGLLNNIAEFPELRLSLMRKEIINPIRSLLHSDSIEISYFSAGVLAHLVSSGEKEWTVKTVSRDLILNELGDVVLQWKQADGEMVTYRSFRPFLPLLNCFETYQAQLWALWAMQHVLTVNASRYYQMLKTENVCDIFHKLIENKITNPTVKRQTEIIMNQLIDYEKKRISSFKF